MTKNPAIFIPGTICALVFWALQAVEEPHGMTFFDQTFWVVLSIHLVLTAVTLTYLTGVAGRIWTERKATFALDMRLFSNVGKIVAIWTVLFLILYLFFAALAFVWPSRGSSSQIEEASIGLLTVLLIAVAVGLLFCSTYALPALVIGRFNIIQAFVLSTRTALRYYQTTLRIYTICFGLWIFFFSALFALYYTFLDHLGIKLPMPVTSMLMALWWFLPASTFFSIAVVGVYVQACDLPKDANASNRLQSPQEGPESTTV